VNVGKEEKPAMKIILRAIISKNIRNGKVKKRESS